MAAINLKDNNALRPSAFARFREAISPLTQSKTAMLGFIMVMFWVIIGLFADDILFRPACWSEDSECKATPWLARYEAQQSFRGQILKDPTAEHWLGTDRQGRDIWARVAHGTRIVLALAPISVIVALLVGGSLGLIAGYFGKWVDEIIMRILDAMIGIPSILMYLVILAALGPSYLTIVLAVTVTGAPGIAKLVRSLTLDIKTRDYIAAAQTRGESPWYIMFVEILPNARGPIMIDAMLRMGYAVFAMGTLGFLGLGLPPPSPDWGSIVNAGRTHLLGGHPWGALAGSLSTATLVLGLNLMADGLQEQLNKYR
ncbi:MAG: ABC transporter permease [Anaerolineae bacterium]|nr:ABC transporter permease [Anaerolineae bacterium]